MNKDAPALVVDLDPIRELMLAVEEVERLWAALPREVREPLARLVWLHPGGDVVMYRPPEGGEEGR